MVKIPVTDLMDEQPPCRTCAAEETSQTDKTATEPSEVLPDQGRKSNHGAGCS